MTRAYEVKVTVYDCPTCGGAYMPSDPPVQCAVFHAPGSCCHLGETRVIVQLSPAVRDRTRG